MAMKLGIDPIHFGIMMVVNMEVGMCHAAGRPQPVRGVSGITKMGITELTKAVWPWLLTMLVFLMVVTYCAGTLDLAAEDPGHDVTPGWRAMTKPRPRPGLFICGRRRLRSTGENAGDPVVFSLLD